LIKEELGNEDKDKISVVDNSNKWIDNSLLTDIIKEECKDLPKIAETDYLQFVQTKGIYTLKQWKSLTEELKKKYPDGLQIILNKVSGK
jgi:hypothetical protein